MKNLTLFLLLCCFSIAAFSTELPVKTYDVKVKGGAIKLKNGKTLNNACDYTIRVSFANETNPYIGFGYQQRFTYYVMDSSYTPITVPISGAYVNLQVNTGSLPYTITLSFLAGYTTHWHVATNSQVGSASYASSIGITGYWPTTYSGFNICAIAY